MKLTLPSETVFYKIENTIKAYRKHAQQKISNSIADITIDQSLTLIYLNKYPDLNQNALAELLFRDNASLTRMIKTMIKHGFIERAMNPEDLRRYKINLTAKGRKVVKALPEIISTNRTEALEGLTEEDEQHLNRILSKIITNCKKHIS